MSDVENTGAAESSEGASSSETADRSAGEGNAPATPAASTPRSMAQKIAAHKGGPEIGSSAQVGAKAAGAAQKSASQSLNTASGVAAEPGVAPAGAAAGTPATPAQVAEAVKAFEANYKFKFMGKDQEIPDKYRGLITDAESEKEVRELHEKAMGLDALRPRFQEQTTQLNGLNKGLKVLDQHLANKDYGKFFQAFGLTDQQIFDYTKGRLEYHQLPPDQKQQMDAEQKLREDYANLQANNASLQEQQSTLRAQQMDTELRGVMSHPSIAPVVERHPGGQQGFYRDVAQHAWFHQQSTGKEFTPEQAVLSYVQQRGLSASPVMQATSQAAETAPTQPGGQAAPRAPTLPTIPSQGTSPAKKVITNMKDLKAARDKANRQSLEN